MIDAKETSYFHIAKPNFKENPIFVDVGAFRGHWTDCVLAEAYDLNEISIILFEPNPDNYNFLIQKYFQDNNIKVFSYIVSNTEEIKDYYKIKHKKGKRKRQNESIVGMSGCVLRNIYRKYQYDILKIQTVKLDTILKNQSIDYLKIDTEGLELDVMQGCSKLLLSQKIKFIQFEYGGTYKDSHISLNDIIKFLNQYNYRVYDLEKNSLRSLEQYTDDFAYNNFLATFISMN